MEMLKNKCILLCEQAKENWNQTGRQKGSQRLMGWHVAQTASLRSLLQNVCNKNLPVVHLTRIAKKSLKGKQSEVKRSAQRITEPEAICPASFSW